MNLDKDPESWARVKPQSVCSGSNAQAVNVLTMALSDIQKMAREIERLRAEKLVAVEFGFRQHEKGMNLQATLAAAARML